MLRIQNIMTTDVATLSPDTSLREAMEFLTRRQISGAPVVSGKNVLGVVSASDLIAFTSDLPAPSAPPPDTGFFSELWDTGDFDSGEPLAPLDTRMLSELQHHVVREVMSTRLITLPSGAPVKKAADVLRRRRIHRLLIVDDGELVGILSTLDIVDAVADGRLTTREHLAGRQTEPAGGW